MRRSVIVSLALIPFLVGMYGRDTGAVLPHWAAALHTWATVASVVYLLVVVAAWFLPNRFRPWFRAAPLASCAYFAPRPSFFIWLIWTSSFVGAAALVLTLRNPDEFREGS